MRAHSLSPDGTGAQAPSRPQIEREDMKRGILIGMALIITALLCSGAIIRGRNYIYSVREEGGIASACVSPGDWEVNTVFFGIGVKNVDYPMMIVDLSNASGKWPHTAAEDTHIHVLSLSTTVNVNETFTGEINIGFLSSVTEDNSIMNHIDGDTYNAYMDIAIRSFKDYTFHPISCRTSEYFGLSETLTNFQSDVAITGPDGATYLSGDGDLVLFIDLGAGNIALDGVVQYVIVAN